MKAGDFVGHWFAGKGVIRWIRRKVALVMWESGKSGIAHVADLSVCRR